MVDSEKNICELDIGDSLYVHMFDNNLNKVPARCDIIGKNTNYYQVKYIDGRVFSLLRDNVEKIFFYTEEQAISALNQEVIK